jgi:hypothetical protein
LIAALEKEEKFSKYDMLYTIPMEYKTITRIVKITGGSYGR